MKLFGLQIQRAEKQLQPVPSAWNWGSRFAGLMPWISEIFPGAWQDNVEVKPEDCLSSPIVYACITLISNDIGKLRARLVRKDENGIWSENDGNSPFWPVLRHPNHFQNHIQFKQWWVMSKLRHGNTYALKERDARGVVRSLYVLDPGRVTPLVGDDGSVFYQLSQDNLAGVEELGITVPASEIIHDRMNCLYHPLVGISPLFAAAIAAGVGIKIQNNTLRFFNNSANPGGILVAPGNISPENAKMIKDQWHSNYSGVNAGKVAVIGDGMKFEPLSHSAVDSQLIETLRWSDERICSVFHVPGYKVGVGSAPGYNNIEAMDRGYYSGCLQSPIEEMEACLDDGLGLDGVTNGVELDLEGLMRMDTKTQMEALKIGVDAGIIAPNEGRKQVNLPPLEGGDTVYMQQQDFPLDQVRQNKIVQPSPAPAPVAEPGDDSDEEKSLILEAKSIIATQKAIEAMRKAAQPEAVHV